MTEHVGEGGEGGSQTVSPTQNSQYWAEQLRTEQVSFLLLLLLCAPAKASHGATCDSQHQQQNTLCWNSESTGAPAAGLTTSCNHYQENVGHTLPPHALTHDETTET